LSDFSLKSDKKKLRENLAIYWMKSLDEIAQLLSNSRWYPTFIFLAIYCSCQTVWASAGRSFQISANAVTPFDDYCSKKKPLVVSLYFG
jgi:hypothetical protein